MSKIHKLKLVKVITPILLASLFLPSAANAQSRIIEVEKTKVTTVPRIIEHSVLTQSSTVRNPRYENEVILPKRSNYSKRLGDMLEQLSFAYQKGWLSSKQYSDLKNWEASVATEELLLRQNGNGIVPQENVNQLEHHLNGLAYTINQEIAAGSKIASNGENTF